MGSRHSFYRHGMPQIDDRELMLLVRGGSRGAFSELVDRYEGRLISYFYRQCGDRQLAEDGAHEVFVRLFRARDRYGPQSRFYDGKLSCVSNVCQHQNGPLGEGRVVDGFITCPWHGYQYCPDTGASPAPFTEQIPTFRLKVADGRVLVHPRPNPAGTRVEPVALGQ